jgi:DNA recombination protein RmuC
MAIQSLLLLCLCLSFLLLCAISVVLFVRGRRLEQRAVLSEQATTCLQTRLQEESLKRSLAEERLAHSESKVQELSMLQSQLKDSFAAMSAEALRQNNQTFFSIASATFEKWQERSVEDMAKGKAALTELVNPLKESLTQFDAHMRGLEVLREGAYRGLKEQVSGLLEEQKKLGKETEKLSRALHTPTLRGVWGEMTLRRLVALAGMNEYCDFDEQKSSEQADTQLRPDLVVHLPGEVSVVVDSKVPLASFLKAIEEIDDDVKKRYQAEHAQALKRHITQLGKKSYYKQFKKSPDFVVLFVPQDAISAVALAADPELIDFAAQQGIVLATPSTLLALLKSIAAGWREYKLSENAAKISLLGQELFERLTQLSSHFSRLGKSIGASVLAYNQLVGSLESRVMVTARRLNDLGGGAKECMPHLNPIESSPREPMILLDSEQKKDVGFEFEASQVEGSNSGVP